MAVDNSIGAFIAQDNEEQKEQAVYYLSRTLNDTKRRYTHIEKLCLTLYFTVIKLRHYLLSNTVYLIARTDIIKYMLSIPILWKINSAYVRILYSVRSKKKTIKGQTLADFLAHHP